MIHIVRTLPLSNTFFTSSCIRVFRVAGHNTCQKQMNTPVLSISNLSTGYRGKVVAQGLTAQLMPASLTALVGQNGAGKSTLLRTLAALQPAMGGEVRWQGRELAEYSPNELARLVAVVLTARTESDALTVEDVVSLGRVPYTGLSGRLSAADYALVEAAMAQMGVEEWRRRRVQTLSDGERQRVMIAKALAQQTPVIMLDEPTAFLDFPGKVALLKLLERLSSLHGKTILFSTHDLELALQLVSRLWVLSADGLAEGTPRALAGDGTISRLFAGAGVIFNAAQMRFVVEGSNTGVASPVIHH